MEGQVEKITDPAMYENYEDALLLIGTMARKTEPYAAWNALVLGKMLFRELFERAEEYTEKLHKLS